MTWYILNESPTPRLFTAVKKMNALSNNETLIYVNGILNTRPHTVQMTVKQLPQERVHVADVLKSTLPYGLSLCPLRLYNTYCVLHVRIHHLILCFHLLAGTWLTEVVRFFTNTLDEKEIYYCSITPLNLYVNHKTPYFKRPTQTLSLHICIYRIVFVFLYVRVSVPIWFPYAQVLYYAHNMLVPPGRKTLI